MSESAADPELVVQLLKRIDELEKENSHLNNVVTELLEERSDKSVSVYEVKAPGEEINTTGDRGTTCPELLSESSNSRRPLNRDDVNIQHCHSDDKDPELFKSIASGYNSLEKLDHNRSFVFTTDGPKKMEGDGRMDQKIPPMRTTASGRSESTDQVNWMWFDKHNPSFQQILPDFVSECIETCRVEGKLSTNVWFRNQWFRVELGSSMTIIPSACHGQGLGYGIRRQGKEEKKMPVG